YRKHALAVLHAMRACAAIAAEIEVFAYRQVGKDSPPFRHMNKSARDDLRRFLAQNVNAIETDRTGSRAHDTRDSAIKRRFPDAVGAEHGDDLAKVHREIDATQNLGLSVAGTKLVDDEQRASVHAMPPALPPRHDRDTPQ